jgi:hypothetical protein
MRGDNRIVLQGEIPSPIDPPSGCRFRPVASSASLLRRQGAGLARTDADHWVACHFADRPELFRPIEQNCPTRDRMTLRRDGDGNGAISGALAAPDARRQARRAATPEARRHYCASRRPANPTSLVRRPGGAGIRSRPILSSMYDTLTEWILKP